MDAYEKKKDKALFDKLFSQCVKDYINIFDSTDSHEFRKFIHRKNKTRYCTMDVGALGVIKEAESIIIENVAARFRRKPQQQSYRMKR